MGASTMSDFALGSNGHCFFCLNQILKPKPPLTKQTNSLQYLTRYLKMDLKKVFIDKAHASPELLNKVGKARLKVELCDECQSLSEKFSKVYRQLEKLELELGSTLGLIHGKLASADATGKLQGLTSGLNSNWNGLLEVVDVLRAEATQKSSFYRFSVMPRVKLQHLTKTEVTATQSMPHKDEDSFQTTPIAEVVLPRVLETRGVRMETSNEGSLSDNGDGNRWSDDDNFNPDGKSMNGYLEMPNKTEEKDRDPDDNILSENMITSNNKIISRTARKIIGTGKYSSAPETGKRKCNDCSKEFSGPGAFTLHYQTVHLKLRYQCVRCNKLFNQNGHLRRHQRTSRSCSVKGSAPKFKCHLCKKSFSLKHHLKDHLEGVHYKLQKYECDLCENKFNVKSKLAAHNRNLHGMGKSYDR